MALTTNRMIEKYDMNDFEITNSSTAAMLTQVETTIDNEEPIAFNAWRPHPMFVRFDIKFLEDPRDTWKLDDIEIGTRSEEHTSELQSRGHLVCRLLLEKKKNKQKTHLK